MSGPESESAPPRRWRRRLLSCFAVLLCLPLAARLALAFFLPTIGDAAIGIIGLSAEIGAHRLRLLAGEVFLEDVVIRPAGGGEPLARIDHLRGSIDWPQLFRGRVFLPSAELEGAAVDLERGEDGALRAVELVREALDLAGRPAAKPKQGEPPVVFGGFGRIRAQGLSVRLHDASVDPPTELTVALDAELDELHLDAPTTPTRWRLAVLGPNPGSSLLSEGSLTLGESLGISLDTLQLRALALAGLAPYLRSAGLAPHSLQDVLDLSASGGFRVAEGGLADLQFELDSLRLGAASTGAAGEGPAPSLALGGLRVRADRLGRAEGFVLDALELETLELALRRAPDGRLDYAGLRALAHEADAALATPEPTTSAHPPLGAERIAVRKAVLRWEDATHSPPLTLQGELSLEATHPVFGGAEPSELRYHLRAHSRGLGSVALVGTATLAGESVRAGGRLEGRDLRLDPLRPYLAPASCEPTLTDARLAADLQVHLDPAAAGGWNTQLSVQALRLRDAARTLLAWDAFDLAASRLDPAGKSFRCELLRLTGLELELNRDEAGRLELPGLTLGPPSRESRGAEDPTKPLSLPEVSLQRLELGARRLRLRDPALTAPLELRELELRNDGPIAWNPARLAQAEPLDLRLRSEVAPLASSLTLRVLVEPFALDPALRLRLNVAGLNPAGLLDLAPRLPARPGELSGGAASLGGELTLRPGRTDPSDLSFVHEGCPAELVLRDLHLTQRTGNRLAGCDRILLEVQELAPGAQALRLERVQVLRPQLAARYAPDGLHALGLVWPIELPGERDELAPPPLAPEVPASTHPAGAEVVVGRFELEDLVFDLVDARLTPPVAVPIRGLDLELEELSSRLLHEPRPLAFRVATQAGEVDLPAARAGWLAEDLTEFLARGPREEELERRLLFANLECSGRLVFVPEPAGEVRADLDDFELAGLRGLAAREGVTLRAGRLDLGASAQLAGGALGLDTHWSFQDLALSEGPGGSLTKLLGLELALDAVLFLLRDEAGRVEVRLASQLDEDQLASGEVTGLILKGLGGALGRAALRSPLRALGALRSLGEGAIRLVTGPSELFRRRPRGVPPAPVAFTAGSRHLPPRAAEALRAALAASRPEQGEVPRITVEHRLSSGDLALLRKRASPPPSEARGLRVLLERRRAALLATRRTLTEAAHQAARRGDAPALEEKARQLQDLDGELERIAEGHAELLALLDPDAGSDWAVARRTRRLAVQLATQRVEAVCREILGLGWKNAAGAIHVRSPSASVTLERSSGGEVVVVPRRRRR